jgi:putative hemolysin
MEKTKKMSTRGGSAWGGKTKITISTGFAITVIIVVAFALGFSFWLGSEYESYEIANPQSHIKRLSDMKNLNDKRNQMANPASVYCVEKKGKLEIRTAEDGSQVGYCKLDNGNECEEWAFFRGECGK